MDLYRLADSLTDLPAPANNAPLNAKEAAALDAMMRNLAGMMQVSEHSLVSGHSLSEQTDGLS